jgi:hypothetical protein
MRTCKLLTFLSLSFLFFSCQKESNNEAQTSSGCKVTKGYDYYVNGTIADSASYTYSNNQLTKVQLNNQEYYTLDYNGDKITKRSFFFWQFNRSKRI